MRVYRPDQHPSLHTRAGDLKRLIDVVAALVGGLLLLPLFLVVAAAIRLDSRGAALITERRVGLHGREFRLYKFRSLHLDGLRQTAPRVTRVGKVLRRTGLDGLPQLINILLGHMSLVGPRPPLPTEVARFEPRHNPMFDVRPGITGMDPHDILNWTLGADLRILMGSQA
jgi:lipopolysaccharide/colanic/teichoic acid biosynthesis glycosyltransferase